MLSKKALKKISKKARKAIRQAKGSACGEENTRTEGAFHISNGENEIPGNADILGVIGKRGRRTDRLCSFQENGSGRNLIILDTPDGAINTWMIPAIYQNIKRGQSVIVTDPEGQLYAETAHIAENHGYDVKIFDPRPINLTHSDGCDILKPLKDQCRDFLGQDYPDFEGVFDDKKVASITALAESYADAVVKSTSASIFERNEKLLLEALLCHVVLDKALNAEGRASLYEVYSLLIKHTVAELDEIFAGLPRKHPGVQPYKEFETCEAKVKDQIVIGLALRLSVYSNKWFCRITAEDEINLTAPLKRRCIYYIVTSDVHPEVRFITRILIDNLFRALCNRYDANIQKDPHMKISFIIDQDIDTGLSQSLADYEEMCHKRNMNITLILRSTCQLGCDRNDTDSILSNASAIILAGGCLDDETVKCISEHIKKDQNYLHKACRTDRCRTTCPFKAVVTMTEMFSCIEKDSLLVIPKEEKPFMLKKYQSTDHSFFSERVTASINRHTPEWLRNADA